MKNFHEWATSKPEEGTGLILRAIVVPGEEGLAGRCNVHLGKNVSPA